MRETTDFAGRVLPLSLNELVYAMHGCIHEDPLFLILHGEFNGASVDAWLYFPGLLKVGKMYFFPSFSTRCIVTIVLIEGQFNVNSNFISNVERGGVEF